jgi:hypothetical protein
VTPAEFDTRRRLLGLSIQETSEWCGTQRRTVERWISGYSNVSPSAVLKLDTLKKNMAVAVDGAVKLARFHDASIVSLARYRSQGAVDASPHAAGLPLGAHAILIGWTADALQEAGFEVVIAWSD